MATTEADRGFPLGPFSGGLNKLEDPRIIGDDQLAVCQNMDIGRSGELTIRPGLQLIRSNLSANPIVVLNSVLLSNNTSRLFVRDSVTSTIYYADGNNINNAVSAYSTTGSTAALQTEIVVQYVNSAWFIPKGVGAVGVRFTLDTNVATSIAGMPRGSGALVFKDRLFIFGPVDANNTSTQRVYYSAAGDFTLWPGANFFDINPGDGEGVTAAIAQGDTLLFFKRHSTWALFYDADPGLGVLRRVNSEIGATGPNSVTGFLNVIYLIDERTVYRIQNLLFTDIGKNIALRFERANLSFTGSNQDFAVNFGPKVVFVVYTGQAVAFEYYIYSTEIDAWTQYVFNEQPNRFYPALGSNGLKEFISTKIGSSNLYVMSPFKDTNAVYGDYPGAITPVTVKTKKYGGETSSMYKRLFWWGFEASSNGILNMTATATNFIDSAVAMLTGTGTFTFMKAFSPQRYRYIEFLITSNSPSHRLTILPGQAYTSGAKNKVTDAVNT